MAVEDNKVDIEGNMVEKPEEIVDTVEEKEGNLAENLQEMADYYWLVFPEETVYLQVSLTKMKIYFFKKYK